MQKNDRRNDELDQGTDRKRQCTRILHIADLVQDAGANSETASLRMRTVQKKRISNEGNDRAPS